MNNMKICILYHPQSDHARRVEDFAHDIFRQHNVTSELVSLESREGAEMARLYDITQYPAIIALRDNGQVAETWVGEQLPLMNDVAAYANEQG